MLKQDLNKLKLFLNKNNLDLLFKDYNKTTTPLIEIALESDCLHQNEKCNAFLSCFFDNVQNPSFEKKFFNHPCKNNHTYKENLFIFSDALPVLRFFVECEFFSMEETISVELESLWNPTPLFSFLKNDLFIDENLNQQNKLKEQKNKNEIKISSKPIYKKNIILETNFLYFSVIYNNYPALQYFLSKSNHCKKNKQALDKIDNLGFNFLTHAILNSDENTCLLLFNQLYDLKQITIYKYNQLESVFYVLSKKINMMNFYNPNSPELNLIVKNLYKTLSFYNLNPQQIILNENNSILVKSILEKNERFFDFLFNRFFVDLRKTIKGLYPIEWCAKYYNVEMLKTICVLQKKYCCDYFPVNDGLDNYYVDFIDIPFFVTFLEKDNFNFKKYKTFVNGVLKNFNVNIKYSNKINNNHLHSICYVLSNETNEKVFNEKFEVFKLFVEKYKLNPYQKNKYGLNCIDVVKNKENKLKIIYYLQETFNEEEFKLLNKEQQSETIANEFDFNFFVKEEQEVENYSNLEYLKQIEEQDSTNFENLEGSEENTEIVATTLSKTLKSQKALKISKKKTLDIE